MLLRFAQSDGSVQLTQSDRTSTADVSAEQPFHGNARARGHHPARRPVALDARPRRAAAPVRTRARARVVGQSGSATRTPHAASGGESRAPGEPPPDRARWSSTTRSSARSHSRAPRRSRRRTSARSSSTCPTSCCRCAMRCSITMPCRPRSRTRSRASLQPQFPGNHPAPRSRPLAPSRHAVVADPARRRRLQVDQRRARASGGATPYCRWSPVRSAKMRARDRRAGTLRRRQIHDPAQQHAPARRRRRRAESVRATDATPCPIADTILRVTPSLGIASLRKRDGHERLFQRARHAALYEAKRPGRRPYRRRFEGTQSACSPEPRCTLRSPPRCHAGLEDTDPAPRARRPDR